MLLGSQAAAAARPSRRCSRILPCRLALLSAVAVTCNAQVDGPLHGYFWVLAEDASVWPFGAPAPIMLATTWSGGLETHAMACNRIGLVPSSREAVLAGGARWNETTAAEITSALGLPAPTLGGCCASSAWCTDTACITHDWGSDSYTNYGFFESSHRPLYTCVTPTYEQLNVCAQDYSALCPVDWTAQSNGFVCVAPASYSGPCQSTWVLGLYTPLDKAQWGLQCGVSWPSECEAVDAPQIEAVTVTSISADSYEIHVEGYGFGDHAENVAVRVGNRNCTDVELCHTVCRPCATDTDCGGGGICLSVTGVAGSFCSQHCDPIDYSCPCDTQCHEAYGAGSNSPYYFCLNPNVELVADLCSAAYATAMGHDDGSTSVRCTMERQMCSTDPVSASVFALPFESSWADVSSVLSIPAVTDSCQTAADCSDGDPCTTDACSGSGCCEHQYVAECITDAGGAKKEFPMLNYVVRTGINIDPRPASWEGTQSSVSHADDASNDYILIPYSMPYFDGRTSTVGISSNGIINMGPAFSCECINMGHTCPFHSCGADQFAHAIALYFSDLDMSVDSSAAVTYNSTNFTIDGEAVHVFIVEYANVPLYGTDVANNLTASVELYSNGRIVLRYASLPLPLPSVAVPQTFVRSRIGLGTLPDSLLQYDLQTLVEPQIAISLCPVPQVVCISPACGVISGGTVVTVTGYMFDHSCLAIGQPPTAGLRCHFGADIVAATPVSSSNGTQIQCTAPAVETAEVRHFQISFGDGLGYTSQEDLAQNTLISLSAPANAVMDTTFTYTAAAENCGCSTSASSLQCDSCGVCGGSNNCIGCDGLYLSGLVFDGCGVCGGDNSSCAGCDGVLYSNLTLDDCYVCDGNNNDKDCDDVCFGSATIDNCSVCAGGNTGLIVNADVDCAGVCNGTSTMDECNVCDADPSNNCTADCVGVWGGYATLDFCEICRCVLQNTYKPMSHSVVPAVLYSSTRVV